MAYLFLAIRPCFWDPTFHHPLRLTVLVSLDAAVIGIEAKDQAGGNSCKSLDVLVSLVVRYHRSSVIFDGLENFHHFLRLINDLVVLQCPILQFPNAVRVSCVTDTLAMVGAKM